MGRRKLIEGQPCRYGHAWNRSSDGKRCLTCYPNALPYDLASPQEKERRQRLLVDRQKVWAAKREADAQRRREARKINENVGQEERNRRNRKKQDFCIIARRGLRSAAGPAGRIASTPELRALWLSQQKRCALTGMLVEGAPHLDHILPVSAGGTHEIDNLQWVHPMANWAKNKYPVEKFEDWLLAAADALRARRQLKELI